MYDDLALLLLGSPLFRDAQLAQVEMCGVVAGRVLRILCLLDISLVQQCRYALAKCLCLRPPAISERRVVGRR